MTLMLRLLLCAMGWHVFAGCAAPVKLTGYPGTNAESQPLEYCKTTGFRDVRVIGILPDPGSYEEIGYMTVGQSSTSELVYTSIEAQIEAARVRACIWGADAIVISESQGDKKNTYSFWTGVSYRDERESRIIAIRFKAPPSSAAPPGGTAQPITSAGTTTSPSQRSTISYRVDRPGTVQIRVFDRTDRVIRTILSERPEVGEFTESWDWRTDAGIEVRDGTYAFDVSLGEILVTSGQLEVAWPQ